VSRIGNEIRRLRKKRGWTQPELAKRVNKSSQVISNWERGYTSLNHEDVSSLAKAFGVPSGALMDDNEISSRKSPPYYALTEKDERDIAKDLEKIMNDLDGNSSLAFHGEPMDEETRRLVSIALENSMRMAREMAKKKFTPKKYRNNNEE